MAPALVRLKLKRFMTVKRTSGAERRWEDIRYQYPWNEQGSGMAKFSKGVSGNPGGRPKVLGEVQELARASMHRQPSASSRAWC
jgi:hypothetical protein